MYFQTIDRGRHSWSFVPMSRVGLCFLMCFVLIPPVWAKTFVHDTKGYSFQYNEAVLDVVSPGFLATDLVVRKLEREKTEEAARRTRETAERTSRELEIQKLETERLNKRSQDLEENHKRLERDFSALNDSQTGELKRLREENRDLGVQLDSAQRQVREFMLRVEQQELIEKRTRLANELAALEARLRELILDGDRLRQEIQDRELQAQTLSAEQGNLERQILEVKQAQRHLLEQSKMKEKPARLRRTGPETESLPGG